MVITKEQQEKLNKSMIELAHGLYKHSIKFFPTVRYKGKTWHPYPGEEITAESAEFHRKTFKLAGYTTAIMPVEREGRMNWYMLLIRKA